MGEKSYGRWTAYGQSKLANAAFATELNRRLQAAGHDTIANSSHPGLVMTNLQTNSMAESGAPLGERILYGLAGPIMAQDVSMGVLPQLYGSTAPEAKGGVFYGPKNSPHPRLPRRAEVQRRLEGCRSAQALLGSLRRTDRRSLSGLKRRCGLARRNCGCEAGLKERSPPGRLERW